MQNAMFCDACFSSSDVVTSTASCLHQADECDPTVISQTVFSKIWSEVSVELLLFLLQQLHFVFLCDTHTPCLLLLFGFFFNFM